MIFLLLRVSHVSLSYVSMSITDVPTCAYVDSADGTRIYAEAVGDPAKPPMVFIHGGSLSSIIFDPIFNDTKWTDRLYLACPFTLYSFSSNNSRFGMTYEDMVGAACPRTTPIGCLPVWPKISTP